MKTTCITSIGPVSSTKGVNTWHDMTPLIAAHWLPCTIRHYYINITYLSMSKYHSIRVEQNCFMRYGSSFLNKHNMLQQEKASSARINVHGYLLCYTCLYIIVCIYIYIRIFVFIFLIVFVKENQCNPFLERNNLRFPSGKFLISTVHFKPWCHHQHTPSSYTQTYKLLSLAFWNSNSIDKFSTLISWEEKQSTISEKTFGLDCSLNTTGLRKGRPFHEPFAPLS